MLNTSGQPTFISWMYGVAGKSNQGQNRIAGFVSLSACVVEPTIPYHACAHHQKFLASVREDSSAGRRGVCFGGGAALILRYSRPASSFVSLRTGVQCSVANQRGGDGTRALMTVSAPASNSANCHCFR